MTNGKIKVWMVGGALRYGGRLLLCRRRPDRGSYPDMWDLPGGHVEPGEDDTAALARESREELGVDVVTSVGVALAELSPGAVLSVRLIVHWRGEPYNAAPKEHREIGFFTTEEMAELRLADARYLPLLTELLRPSPSVEIRRLDDEAWDSVGALHALSKQETYSPLLPSPPRVRFLPADLTERWRTRAWSGCIEPPWRACAGKADRICTCGSWQETFGPGASMRSTAGGRPVVIG